MEEVKPALAGMSILTRRNDRISSMRCALRLVLWLIGLVIAAPVFAGPEMGPRVRVQLFDNDKPVTGSLLGIENGSLRVAEGSGVRRIPLSEILSLEYQAGVRTHEKQGALVGLVVGLTTGFALGAQFELSLMTPPEEPQPHVRDSGAMVILGFVGSLVGAALGAGVGSLIETPKWVAAPELSMDDSGRFGVGFTLRLTDPERR
jgi:hypothetical protein